MDAPSLLKGGDGATGQNLEVIISFPWGNRKFQKPPNAAIYPEKIYKHIEKNIEILFNILALNLIFKRMFQCKKHIGNTARFMRKSEVEQRGGVYSR